VERGVGVEVNAVQVEVNVVQRVSSLVIGALGRVPYDLEPVEAPGRAPY
jgi:hypothetical protein